MSLGKKIPRVTRASWIVRIDHYDKWERRLVTSELSIPSDRHQRARIVSFLLANWRYRSSDRTYTLSPLTFLYTIFDNSPQHRGERLRDASQRSAGICRWRFVDYAFPSRTHQVRLRCPRFRRGVCVCFLNNFHRQHSLNVAPPVSAHATGRAIHAHAESDRAIISLLSEILKTTETKSMRSYFSYSIHSTDLTSTPISPLISTFLLYFDCLLTSLSVYALALLVKLALGKNAGLIGWFNWFQRVHKNKGICRKYLRIKSSRIDKR